MSTLKTLKEDMSAKKWREIAEDIIKYQDFKTAIAIKRMRGKVSDTTKKNYITSGRHFLRTGEQYSTCNVGVSLFKWLEIVKKEHLQPLTPKDNERGKEMKPRKKDYTRKDAKVPIAELDIIKKPVSSKFEYGVKYGDVIYLAKNEDYAEVFLKGVTATGNNAKIVSVEIGEV